MEIRNNIGGTIVPAVLLGLIGLVLLFWPRLLMKFYPKKHDQGGKPVILNGTDNQLIGQW